MSNRVVIGLDIETDRPVYLPQSSRLQGTYMVGKTGFGKSTLLLNMIVQDMNQGYGLCLLDPVGDLTGDVLARIPSSRENDVILLDASDPEYAFGLNPFDLQQRDSMGAIDTYAAKFMDMFRKIWETDDSAGWGPLLEDMFENIAYTMLENPGYTLYEVPRLLSEKSFRDHLIRNMKNDTAREFWEDEYPVDGSREQREYRMPVTRRVRSFLRSAYIGDIISQSSTTVDFSTAINENKIILVKLPVRPLGRGAVSLLGTTIVNEIFSAVLARGELDRDDRTQFNLYADEFHYFATPDFADMITQLRKYGLALTIAHQDREQVPARYRNAPLNAANFIVFRVQGVDGRVLAKEFSLKPESGPIRQQARLSISQEPVQQLLRNGHESPVVRSFTATYLHPMNEVDKIHRFERDYYSGDVDRLNWGQNRFKSKLPEALKRIDRYLLDAMEGRISTEEYKSHPKIAQMTSYHVGIRGVGEYTSELDKNIWSLLLELVAARSQGNDTKAAGVIKQLTPLWNKKYNYRFEDSPPRDSISDTERFIARMDTYITQLIATVERLRDAPIMVASGQYDEIADNRPLADIELELANTLATMPRYHARVKLEGDNESEKYTVLTHPDPPAEKDQLKINLIRERSRNLYARPRKCVKKEIRKRAKWEPPLEVETLVYNDAVRQRQIKPRQP